LRKSSKNPRFSDFSSAPGGAPRLLPAPGSLAAAILQNNSLLQQPLTYVVGSLEVFPIARGPARRDELLDFPGRQVGTALQEGPGIPLEDAEYPAEGAQLPCQGFLAAVHPAGELEEHGDGLRRIEVVVHRLLEARAVG